MEISASFILQMTKLRVSKLKEYVSNPTKDTYTPVTEPGPELRASAPVPCAFCNLLLVTLPQVGGLWSWASTSVCHSLVPETHSYLQALLLHTHFTPGLVFPHSAPASEPSVPLLILREVCRHSGLFQSFWRVFSLWRGGGNNSRHPATIDEWNTGCSRVMITALDLKHLKIQVLSNKERDSPGGAVVKNPPCKTRDVGLISGWRAKMPHAMGQLSPNATK